MHELAQRRIGDAHGRRRTNWGKFAGYGLNLAVGIVLGYFIGRWVDQRYGWESRGALTGAALGFAGGMYLFIKEAIKMNKD